LGISALIVPLGVDRQLVLLDVPLMIAASITTYGMSLDGQINRIEGGLLFGGLVAYTLWSIWKSRQQSNPEVLQEFSEEFPRVEQPGAKFVLLQCALLLLGLAMLVKGADLFLDSAVVLARGWGFSELVIGLTLVAAGTSLPEVATSVVAAIKGERDLAVGNVIGSSLFNLLGVLGFAGLIAPAGIPVSESAMSQDIPVLLATAIACIPIFLTGNCIARWEGGLLFSYHLIYTAYLIFSAQQWQSGIDGIAQLLWVMVPLTLAALAISLLKNSARPTPATANVLPPEQDQP
ncbi:MAG: hypothetical protein KDA58_06655, partial [Planctomycetaceae bacterium]|nr:hypothetical protein [Planctomycetaceae bacterium]